MLSQSQTLNVERLWLRGRVGHPLISGSIAGPSSLHVEVQDTEPQISPKGCAIGV